MSRTPQTLQSFPREMYALITHACNMPEDIELAMSTTGEAQHLVHELNKMRRSLNHWAPTHDLTGKANSLKFAKTIRNGVDLVVLSKKHQMVKMLVQDEKFKKVLAEIKIPEVEQVKSQSQSGSPAEGGGLRELHSTPVQPPEPDSAITSTEQLNNEVEINSETETYIISRPQTGDYLNKLFSVGDDADTDNPTETESP